MSKGEVERLSLPLDEIEYPEENHRARNINPDRY